MQIFADSRGSCFEHSKNLLDLLNLLTAIKNPPCAQSICENQHTIPEQRLSPSDNIPMKNSTFFLLLEFGKKI